MVFALFWGAVASRYRAALQSEGSNSLSVGEIPGKPGFGSSLLKREEDFLGRWLRLASCFYAVCSSYAKCGFSMFHAGGMENVYEVVGLEDVCLKSSDSGTTEAVRVDVCAIALSAL